MALQLTLLDTAHAFLLQAAPSPQAAATSTQAVTTSTQYSTGSLVLVVLLFVLLGFLFYLLIIWSNRLDQTGYLGTLYRDTIQDIEYKRLAGTSNWKWE